MPARRPVVFLGPSCPIAEARDLVDAEFRPPCRRGDFGTLGAGSVVALIDGVFHQAEAVSPREIFDAIARGVTVFGAASMGALRALEVPGMHGLGRVFEMYRLGLVDGDDEVAVAFDPERMCPLTVPLVNVRWAVERLARAGSIDASDAAAILRSATELHYTERRYRDILAGAGFGTGVRAAELRHLLSAHDLKRADARLLLETLPNPQTAAVESHPEPTARPPASLPYNFAATEPTAPPYQRRTDARRLAQRRPSQASILIWETGDQCTLSELLDFLILTGRWKRHVNSAVSRLLSSGDVRARKESKLSVKREFLQICRSWGWLSSEETRVTLADLGLSARRVFAHLGRDAFLNAVGEVLVRTKAPVLLHALKAEMLISDIALKREAMILGSLRQLGRGRITPSPREVEWASRLMCRLHDVPSFTEAQERLRQLGLTSSRTARFLKTLAKAHRDAERIHLGGASASKSSRTINGDSGIAESPKPEGERRFSLLVPDASGHADRLRELIGITRIGTISGLSDLPSVFVTQAARPGGAWSSSYGSGKSRSKVGAAVGGVMEEFEKWSQEQFVGEPVWGTYRALRAQARVVDPSELSLPYDSPFHPDLETSWQKCRDLMRSDKVFVPMGLIALPATAGRNNVMRSVRAARVIFSTNGLASGFSLAEALLHGLCECIERHETKLAELRVANPGLDDTEWRPRRIDAASLPEQDREFINHLARAGYSPYIWDIRWSVQVPTIYAHLVKDGKISSGWMTHPDPVVACEGALLEACQSVAGTIAGGREDATVHARSLGRHERPRPIRVTALKFWTSERCMPVPVGELGGAQLRDIRDEVLWVRQKLSEAGIRSVPWVDLTVIEGLPARAIRVIIPGFETTNPFHCGPWGRNILLADVWRHA